MEMKNPGNLSSQAVRRTRAVPALLVVLMLPVVFHCGGSNEVTEPPPSRPTLTPTETPAAPDLVRISGGEGIRSDLVRVDIEIGGPTTSTDIATISFDVVIGDPSMISPASAPGESSPFTAGDVFPGVLGTHFLTIGSPQITEGPAGRFFVSAGIQKLAVTPDPLVGVGVGAGGASVLSITFQTLKTGSTTLKLEDPKVYDSAAQEILSITFDAATATITQP
jgi:hypothetical protein